METYMNEWFTEMWDKGSLQRGGHEVDGVLNNNYLTFSTPRQTEVYHPSSTPRPQEAVTPLIEGNYKVIKMKFSTNGKEKDKTKIIYNDHITIENIPLEAYEYIVNGKSAIEWIIDRYQVKTDKDSGITNDPNEWCEEHENPRYIIDLLHSVINLSVKTVEIVNNLPTFELLDISNASQEI